MQETSTIKILLCIKNKDINIHNCNIDKKSLMDTKIELTKDLVHLLYSINFTHM